MHRDHRAMRGARRRTPNRGTLLLASLTMSLGLATSTATAVEYTATVVATGLNSPRGLGQSTTDDGIWVAEAGFAGGGGPSTVVRGETITFNTSGSLTRILNGTQQRLVTGLPSLYSSSTGQMEAGPNDVLMSYPGFPTALIGAGINPALRTTDLAPVGGQLGRLYTQVNCLPEFYNGDISAHELAANPAGGPVDSNPFRMVDAGRAGGGFLVTDAGANALLRISTAGVVSTVATFSERAFGSPRPTESVPTGVAVAADGTIYVSELTGVPFPTGAARIHRVLPDGTQSVFATGFTMLIDIGLDADGSLLALEYDTNGLFAPGSAGALWRLDAAGGRSLVWSDGLVQPTGLHVARDGSIYISNFGNGAGLGQVLRVSPVPEAGTQALTLLGLGLMGVAARLKRRAR